uniref:Uncharacterized protein n=1 Tax=Ditylenchus dipsaci TaxID=166011 RepID=A0A915CZ62_9BILA
MGVVPLLFDNLWIIYARLAHTLSLWYSRSSDRKTETYEFVLKKLVELRPTFRQQVLPWTSNWEFNAFKDQSGGYQHGKELER